MGEPNRSTTAPVLLFQNVLPRIWGFETWNFECWSTDTSAFLIYFLDPGEVQYKPGLELILAEDGTLDAAVEVAASRVCAPQLCLRPFHVPFVLASCTGVSPNNFMAFWLTTHATATRGALNSLQRMFLLKEQPAYCTSPSPPPRVRTDLRWCLYANLMKSSSK